MILSRKNLPAVNQANIEVPSSAIFELPEKVLQFGTGVLLRGLPDYFIDKANKAGVFNGRIVVIKSTDRGDTDAFETQDGLYTHCIRGIRNQQMTDEYIVNASISSVLSAKKNWEEILAFAVNPNLELIISNTTEAGLVLLSNDNVHAQPPISFPAKLLAILYERYTAFNGDTEKGLVIVPTELITDNGTLLKEILLELSAQNKLEKRFTDWLQNANNFCNSLVDRIVPGKLSTDQVKRMETDFGYKDELAIMSEPYSLWAIETSNQKAKEVLNFAKIDETVIITNDINKYRELKLRLLNGTHTFSCGLACLAGFETVKGAMENEQMKKYITSLMTKEIVSCVVSENIPEEEAITFSKQVAERFQNPFIDHKWMSITLNYTQKMKLRNVPVLVQYFEQHHKVPQYMALGFAAYLMFMQCVPAENNSYFVEINGIKYPLQDEAAAYFSDLWKNTPSNNIAAAALSNANLWGTDLAFLNGFAVAVASYMQSIKENGALKTLQSFNANND